jgi:hypothetical protein
MLTECHDHSNWLALCLISFLHYILLLSHFSCVAYYFTVKIWKHQSLPKQLPDNTVSLQITALRTLTFISRAWPLKEYHKTLYASNNKRCTICNISFWTPSLMSIIVQDHMHICWAVCKRFTCSSPKSYICWSISESLVYIRATTSTRWLYDKAEYARLGHRQPISNTGNTIMFP